MCKMRKQGKFNNKTKHGLWGDIVHKYTGATSSGSKDANISIEIETPVPKRGRPKGSTNKKTPKKAIQPKKKSEINVSSDDEEDDNSGQRSKVDVSKLYYCRCAHYTLS